MPEETVTLEETITTTVSDKAEVEWIRAKIREGRFATEADAIAEGIARLREDDEELEVWLSTEGKSRYDSYLANPTDVYTIEQVEEHLAERRKQRAE